MERTREAIDSVHEDDEQMSRQYEAILVVSFGGPEGMDEVMPFLENVLRGKNVPRQRMLEVAHHYEAFGGVSPINEQNRQLIDALEGELARHGPDLPIYWGNRNWHPLLADTLRQMRDDGVRRALAFVTAAFSCYSGCRQYREDLERARQEVGEGAPEVDKIRVFYNHPGFIESNFDRLQEAFAQLSPGNRDRAHLVFTAHSIPKSMAEHCDYEAQLDDCCRLLVEALGLEDERWSLVYQSRSGPPSQPWLEPDVGDYLQVLKGNGTRAVVISPIGFISDHLEVLYDLDTEARELCQKLGLEMIRAGTAGVHPKFVAMIRELIQERSSQEPERRALGKRGPSHDVCPPDCCRYEPRRPGGHPQGRPTASSPGSGS